MQSVSILCTDPDHPVNSWLTAWAQREAGRARTEIRRNCAELVGGDFLFLVSCHQIIRKPVRDLYRHTLVLHASALPKGRGMSPHVWQILEGAERITLSLLDAEDALDSGAIWHQADIAFDCTELHQEINRKLFDAEVAMMSWALEHCDTNVPRPQQGEGSFYRKRSPADSQIDPTLPLVESFDLLRVADPDRYPAFFEHRGQKYRIRLDKL
jgi:methionyl-tRNA formyltransferase